MGRAEGNERASDETYGSRGVDHKGLSKGEDSLLGSGHTSLEDEEVVLDKTAARGEGRKRVSFESRLDDILARPSDPAYGGRWDALVRESTHGVDVLLGDVCEGRESEMSVPRISI